MSVRAGCIVLAAIAFFATGPAWGGYYNSTDAPEDTRFSQDYERFRNVLSDLKNIANADSPTNPPMRRRYLFVEALGHKGAGGLTTLQDKLDYSAVLIRRGKADEAAALLFPLTRENPDQFLVQVQSAAAHFLASNDDFRRKAPEDMQEALKAWPERWEDLKENQRVLLTSMGWEATAFERNRRYEVYFERLVRNRLREERLRRKKMPIEETVDPIFLGDDKKPVRFVNEEGQFEAGRIADAEFKKLPPDAIEAVEQLLIWMPNDDRLLWQLAEVFNASAAGQKGRDAAKQRDARNDMVRNAHLVMQQLMNEAFKVRNIYARDQVKSQADVLADAVAKMPPPNELNPERVPDLDVPSELTGQQWWRAISVGFVTGFLVGLFALWQFQEMRRRRLARRR